MDRHVVADDRIAGPAGWRCGCPQPGRRRFGAALLLSAALPQAALAQTIPECKRSTFTKMVSAQQVEQAATQQYRQMLQQASAQKALGPKDHPQVVRLRAIAQRIIPYTSECNEAAKSWQWEVNLLGSQELNAFCMPRRWAEPLQPACAVARGCLLEPAAPKRRARVVAAAAGLIAPGRWCPARRPGAGAPTR